MKEKVILMLFALIIAMPIFGQNLQTKRVAILEIVDKEGTVPYGVKLMIRSKLTSVITETDGYEGYDRVDIGSILGEHEFQRTGLVSEKDIKRLGEMTGADYILVAEVASLNSSYLFLSAKILNVETALVKRAADVQTPSTVEGLDENCKTLAGKLLDVNVATGASKGTLNLNIGKYVGEYLNGLPHGYGTIYFKADDKNGRSSYKGNWKDGQREGEGTMIWTSGQKYVGAWRDNTRNGYGKCYYSDGKIYEGNYLKGKHHGKGKLTYAADDSLDRAYYEGDWVGGCKHGSGKMVWNNGSRYEGGFKNDEFHGKGIYYWNDGDYEVGYYIDGKQTGDAVLYHPNGRYEKGQYEDNKKVGRWVLYSPNGEYIGAKYK